MSTTYRNILLAIAALLVAVAFCFLHRSPAPIPLQVSSSSAALATSTASQSIKITIRRPSAPQKPYDTATPNDSKTTTQHKPVSGLLGKVSRVFAPDDKQARLNEAHSGPSVDSGVFEQPEDEITIELTQNMASSTSASSSTLVDLPSSTHQVSSIGIIAGTLPGVVAVDLQVIKLGMLNVDLAGNHRAIGAGISAGGKIFGIAGGYQDFDGERGIFAGAGVRF